MAMLRWGTLVGVGLALAFCGRGRVSDHGPEREPCGIFRAEVLDSPIPKSRLPEPSHLGQNKVSSAKPDTIATKAGRTRV